MGTIQIDGSTPKLTIGNATAEDALILFDGNAQDFHIGLDDTADDLVIGVGSALGTTTALAIDENAGSTFSGTVTVGVDDTGKDVKFFGATSGSFLLWDESADSLLLTDSTPIKIGDAQDLTLYHDGSNSYITNAVGALKIATETSGIALTIGHTTSEVTIGDNLTTTGTLTVGSTGITANGITEADTWRVNSNFQGNAEPIASNWEREDTDANINLGTGMTESSGIFTFPSTGVYEIIFVHVYSGAGDNHYIQSSIDVTTDNSSYSLASKAWGSAAGNGVYGTSTLTKILDVTNTTNTKVRFSTTSQDTDAHTQTATDQNLTYITFKRIGDT